MRPPSTLRRRALPLAIALALAAMAAAALAQVGGPPAARGAAIAASGSFGMTNSRDGEPIFSATGIVPGGSTSGTVTIEDSGSGPIALKLHRGELVDTPGIGGGLLSGRLRLTVLDITRPTSPLTVWSGPLDAMPDCPAGELEAGESRTYEFVATLPDGGPAGFQNAVQGAASTVAYSWIAEEAGGGGEEAGDGNGGGGQPGGGTAGGGIPPSNSNGDGSGSVGGNGGNPPTDGGTSPVVGTFRLTVPKVKRAIRGGRLVVWTVCDSACRLSVRGRIRATVPGAHRGAPIRYAKRKLLPPGAQRLRIPIPRRLRRWILETSGRPRVRAKLRFLAVGTSGQRDVVRKTVRLRARRSHR